MHRIPIRYKVGSWQFSYSNLTEEEKRYMESLFPDAADFAFTHPDRLDSDNPVTLPIGAGCFIGQSISAL